VFTQETTATVRRTVTDFALGFATFALVAGCVAVSDGQAAVTSADAAAWVTTVSFVPDTGIAARLQGGQSWAWLLLGLTCGALTAFNMSIARHLKAVAVAGHGPEQQRALHQDY
jgi:hypothetical protein